MAAGIDSPAATASASSSAQSDVDRTLPGAGPHSEETVHTCNSQERADESARTQGHERGAQRRGWARAEGEAGEDETGDPCECLA